MKAYRLLLIAVFLISTLVVFVSGCEYDITESQWNNPYQEPGLKPKINSVNPSAAIPGVNTITITGENFNLVPDTNIYLDNPDGVNGLLPEVIEKTPTSITIRRPNIVGDSCVVKLVPDSGLVVKFGPYKIDPVLEQYGSLLENQQLGAVVVDNAENLYVATGVTPFTINKVTPDGQKTIFVDTLPSPPAAVPTDMKIGPDGSLYLLRSNRLIQRANLTTGEVSSWHNLRTSRQLRVGAFDSNGYLYAGGIRTSLWVIAPDSTSQELASMYPTAAGDSMMAMKIYQNYLYIAIASASGRIVVRHSIGAGGNLGSSEVVVNLSQFTSQMIRDFAIASDGTFFIATDGDNPLITYNPGTGKFDYFYMNILPPYAKQINWGTGDYLYMISGNTTPAQNWTIYRVDMGITTAP